MLLVAGSKVSESSIKLALNIYYVQRRKNLSQKSFKGDGVVSSEATDKM